jgi:hypothetical protein|tara:strand:- start:4523 stop:4753 length:231 start_codon:yes stop_codon:yes gene_type:complete
MTKKLIHTPENPEGVLVDMTAEEISAAEASYQAGEDEKAQKAADAQAKKDLKASAKAKLIAGEPLTEEEANVMIGG